MAWFCIRFTEFSLFEKNELRIAEDVYALKFMFVVHDF
jgi:hypothetical protein